MKGDRRLGLIKFLGDNNIFLIVFQAVKLI
jgi:hypothetical protein